MRFLLILFVLLAGCCGSRVDDHEQRIRELEQQMKERQEAIEVVD